MYLILNYPIHIYCYQMKSINIYPKFSLLNRKEILTYILKHSYRVYANLKSD